MQEKLNRRKTLEHIPQRCTTGCELGKQRFSQGSATATNLKHLWFHHRQHSGSGFYSVPQVVCFFHVHYPKKQDFLYFYLRLRNINFRPRWLPVKINIHPYHHAPCKGLSTFQDQAGLSVMEVHEEEPAHALSTQMWVLHYFERRILLEI